MKFVNLTGQDLFLKFMVAPGVTEEKAVPAAACQMQVLEGTMVGTIEEVELWVMERHQVRLQYNNGNNYDAWTCGYQWSVGVMYIVSHEVLMALEGMSSDLHFAAPIGAVPNRPNTYTGLQVLQPGGRLSKSLSRWPG